MSNFYFCGLQNHWGQWLQPLKLKDCLLLGRKAMTNLDSVLKTRDITLLTVVHTRQSYGFSSSLVWLLEVDHKKGPRIDAFEVWCWRRLSRVPWTARRSNQSILKEINPEYSLEGLVLELTLQSFGPWWEQLVHWKRPWYWERLRARGEGWDGWMASPTQQTWVWANSGRQGRTGKPVHGVPKSWAWLSNWTTTTKTMNETLRLKEECNIPCSLVYFHYSPWLFQKLFSIGPGKLSSSQTLMQFSLPSSLPSSLPRLC